ncbi:C40 family peptidase [Leptotrichia sp. oral taxon 879]|uniref:C40 family peptidase n=1 Tax=Leptotrichia sp. oral taxon 879 TaxID=1227267 RepID=UPI0003AE6CE8|nr:NlpC/P60 family protein [Leptotrichia sp. oral taxon 879]ERK52422.1 NlpC/P60 family protein [Leptotrichia sp. oral taxon 879 str. F0557]
MVRKSTFTMACMLMTVGCANLQTNETSKGKTGETNNNDFSSKNNLGNENITIEIIGGKKEKIENHYSTSNNSSEQKKSAHKSTDTVRKSEKYSELNEKIDDLKVTKLFDENRLVDRSMPNSQLVLQKLSELKRRHQEILLNGTFSQKKTVELQNQLLKAYSNWKGTKYSLGGDSENGMDCSALTRRVYREVYGYELPRQTVQQVKVGTHVSKENLKPGDIVFFRPEEKNNHTAVYLGDTLFINASASKGVVISTLENTYWNKYFKYGVRIREV